MATATTIATSQATRQRFQAASKFWKLVSSPPQIRAKTKAPQPRSSRWSSDGVPVEASNVAGIGTDEDRALRRRSAETEEAWASVGDEPGLWVWRIEQFVVVPWPKEEHGNFFRRDSYIVLDRHPDEETGKLHSSIHFWLGSQTAQDEMGTAAYKTVELDEFLGGLATQHREIEGHESEDFLNLFPELHYLEGGVESGFHHVQPDAAISKLFMVRREKRAVKVREVPLARASLNHGDCFVLDAGEKVFLWFGDDCSPFERNECNQLAQRLQSKRAGHAHVVPFDADPATFWSLLGGEGAVASAEAGNRLAPRLSMDVGQGVLHRLSDSSGSLLFSEVARQKLSKRMLDTGDVFVLDVGKEIFVWIGSEASRLERSKAMETATTYLSSQDKPATTPVHLFKEGSRIRNRRWKAIMD